MFCEAYKNTAELTFETISSQEWRMKMKMESFTAESLRQVKISFCLSRALSLLQPSSRSWLVVLSRCKHFKFSNHQQKRQMTFLEKFITKCNHNLI